MGSLYTYDVNEQPRCVSYYKKRNQEELGPTPHLYSQYPIPIKAAKAEDVLKLVNEYLPPKYRYFYAEMPVIEGEADESSDEN